MWSETHLWGSVAQFVLVAAAGDFHWRCGEGSQSYWSGERRWERFLKKLGCEEVKINNS